MPYGRRLSLPFDGAKVRTLRERQGLTLRDLEQRTEQAGDRIHFSILCHYESGRRGPNAPRLKVLADALDCTIDDLLTPPSEAVKECA
ncbi:helix-turn-helix transcriptional regulator [Microbispora amethystogenes]|uniref:helix-turn-helix domain-containing protein n=1 Tax=Microbispora amethystogenes TaxID=1427754 RepID=UPI0033F8E6FC